MLAVAVAIVKASKVPLAPVVVAREKLARDGRQRVPEPMIMDDAAAVREYDAIGATLQRGVHHFSALAIGRMLPKGGTVLDLGCGSGRLLARLARGRPDARIVGVDLSEPMLETGRALLEREGLTDRVELRKGDITTFDSGLAEQPDVVSCNFALHHLPTEELAGDCLGAIARARESSGCAVWIFDFARLRHPGSWPAFTSMLIWPGPVALNDAIASERAAFTGAEFIALLDRAGLDDLEHVRSWPVGEFQVAWAARRGGGSATSGLWCAAPLPPDARLLARLIIASFPGSLTHA